MSKHVFSLNLALIFCSKINLIAAFIVELTPICNHQTITFYFDLVNFSL